MERVNGIEVSMVSEVRPFKNNASTTMLNTLISIDGIRFCPCTDNIWLQ
ncbi:MAG: hypothetical protein WC637_06625 [Victivallales bacterium]